MKKIFTIDEIRERFTVDDSPETCTQLAEMLRNQMEQDETADLVVSIIDKLDEAAAKDPAEKAAMDSWTQIERILFFVREAYVAGQLMGYHVMGETMRAEFDALERGEE